MRSFRNLSYPIARSFSRKRYLRQRKTVDTVLAGHPIHCHSSSRPKRVAKVLGTDGLWEMRDPSGEMFGKDRLRDLMRHHRAEPVAEIAAAIEGSLDAFRAGGTQMDDVTFLVIRLK
jgi:hypothetical protein